MGWGEIIASAGGLAVLALGLAEIGARLSRGIDDLFNRDWPEDEPASWSDFDIATSGRETDEVDHLRRRGGL